MGLVEPHGDDRRRRLGGVPCQLHRRDVVVMGGEVTLGDAEVDPGRARDVDVDRRRAGVDEGVKLLRLVEGWRDLFDREAVGGRDRELADADLEAVAQ
ncbi:hypothetical protein [Nannocystis pusilla]|uniref:hypothetical protein n=1 Tax=Nannocystis pusilla TaxID=889268 RepID=UPI003B815058